MRSRNTVEFLEEWEVQNNPDFDKLAYKKLLTDLHSPRITLTPKKWIDTTKTIGLISKRGKTGGTMAHPFIACDFEMWNDSRFRYHVIKEYLIRQAL